MTLRRESISMSFVLMLLLASSSLAVEAESGPGEEQQVPCEGDRRQPEVHWHLEYRPAVRAAQADHRLLLIYFRDEAQTESQKQVDELLLRDRDVRAELCGVTCCKVSCDERLLVEGKEIKLLAHGAFAELLGRAGLAIVDYRDTDDPLFGRVVSVLPLSRRKLDRRQLLVLLNLPRGTLTQRTLIFAVRTHPEQPASTTGQFASLLAEESADHSLHQANITLQGHHGWNRRFHRINRRLPAGMVAQEVCAESWPGQGLFDAAIECVRSWRQSPGHWNAVRSRQAMFGYDMKRGRNGVWYATGIFARGG